jgi:hypothetical protein
VILNWTPHRLDVYDSSLTLVASIEPAGYAPRLAERRTLLGSIDGIPLTRVDRDRLAAPLPPIAPDVGAVVVSEIVAEAVRAALVAAGRPDVLVLCPDTGPGYAVRRAADGNLSAAPAATGAVAGVLALRQVAP